MLSYKVTKVTKVEVIHMTDKDKYRGRLENENIELWMFLSIDLYSSFWFINYFNFFFIFLFYYSCSFKFPFSQFSHLILQMFLPNDCWYIYFISISFCYLLFSFHFSLVFLLLFILLLLFFSFFSIFKRQTLTVSTYLFSFFVYI